MLERGDAHLEVVTSDREVEGDRGGGGGLDGTGHALPPCRPGQVDDGVGSGVLGGGQGHGSAHRGTDHDDPPGPVGPRPVHGDAGLGQRVTSDGGFAAGGAVQAVVDQDGAEAVVGHQHGEGDPSAEPTGAGLVEEHGGGVSLPVGDAAERARAVGGAEADDVPGGIEVAPLADRLRGLLGRQWHRRGLGRRRGVPDVDLGTARRQ